MKHLHTIIAWALLLFPFGSHGQKAVSPTPKEVANGSSANQTKTTGTDTSKTAVTKKARQTQKKSVPKPAAGNKNKAPAEAKTATPYKPAEKAKAALGSKQRRRNAPDVKRDAIAARTASTRGPIGLDEVWSADPGPLHTARLRLSLGFFDTSDFPTVGADNRFAATDIAAAFTAHRLVETFLSLRATGNTNFSEQPALLQTQGDVRFGVKVGGFINDMVAVGGAVGVRMLTGVGQGGFDPDATSFDLRLLTTFDLHRSGRGPTRLLLDLGYVVENSHAVIDTLATEPSLIQEFGLQVARYNRLTFGLGIDSPFHKYVSAFLEYGISLPILVQPWVVGEGAGDYGFSSIPHSLTLGVRGFPVEQLAIDLGLRIGLSDEPFTGVPATPPWTLLFGVAYTIDPKPKVEIRERVVEKKVVNDKQAGPAGQVVAGTVVDGKTQKPIAGAQIAYPSASSLSPQVTDSAGRFGGYRFGSGPVSVQVTAPGYKALAAKGTVQSSAPLNLMIKLEEDPATRDGLVKIRVFDPNGRPIDAQVSFSGEAAGVSGKSTRKKPFESKVKSGRHPVIITAKGYPPLRQMANIKGGETVSLKFTVERAARSSVRPVVQSNRSAGAAQPRSATSGGGSLARVTTQGIVLRKPVTFAANSSTLDAQGKAVLKQVASGLKRVSAITRVLIGAHVVSQSSKIQNGNLSNERARSVRSYLISQGVEGRRLQARGYGSTKPRYPNFSPRGRRKNERIEFAILKTK